MKLQLNHNKLEVLSHKVDQQKESGAGDSDRRSTAFRSAVTYMYIGVHVVRVYIPLTL